jgi:hypothetical protein
MLLILVVLTAFLACAPASWATFPGTNDNR